MKESYNSMVMPDWSDAAKSALSSDRKSIYRMLFITLSLALFRKKIAVMTGTPYAKAVDAQDVQTWKP